MRACFLLPIALLAPNAERAGAGPPQAATVKLVSIGCPNGVPITWAQPVDTGPVRLSIVRCIGGVPGYSFGRFQLSPDGRHLFANDPKKGVWIWAMAGGGSVFAPLTNAGAGMSFIGADTTIGWRRDSRGLWAAGQPIMTPRGGWALGALRTSAIALDGRSAALPSLLHPSGNLDQIAWIGGDGFALATFGNRGGYYKPELPNPDPRIALIDARRARIIATMRLPDAPRLKGMKLSVVALSGVMNARGLPHVVMWMGQDRWFDWNGGGAPREAALPAYNGWVKFALTGDGRRVLIAPGLSATGMICERNPKCPPPTPQTGAAIELRDLATGELVWSLRRTATNFSRSEQPAISSDGRHALILLPVEGSQRETVALIDMRDGRVVQRLGMAGDAQSFGFTADGRTIWIGGHSTVAIYRFR